MTSATTEEIIKWLLNNGSGPAVLTVVAITVLRWLKPRVEGFIEAHLALIKTLTESAVEQGAYAKKQSEMSQVLTSFVREVHGRMKQKGSTILVIEDNAIAQDLIRRFLSKPVHDRNLTLVVVTSLRDAVELIAISRLIILDILLPDANYIETSKLFSCLCPCPVIVFTGLERDAVTGYTCPVIFKNDGYDKLVEAVTEALDKDD